MNKLPEKFTIPDERIPRAWSQGVYGCCVAASITKVLEVINYIKTGTYKKLSKGYTYGRHSRPDKTQGGMGYAYAMNSLLQCGTVPEEMFSVMDEIPSIIEKVENHPDREKLYDEAKKMKIHTFTKIKGDIHFYDNVKQCLYEKQMPLVGNMVGKRHCAVIVGWDGDKLLYHDHKGTNKLFKGRFNEAYYLDGGIEEVKEFKSFNIDQFKNYISQLNISRQIKYIQLHHTYSPSYKDFKNNNHQKLQNGMRDYHIRTNGWSEIGQNLTIFPDGVIMLGRDFNIAPAGIKGANSNGICIECLGNFDVGGDTMTDAQKNAIVGVVAVLLKKFNLNAMDNVTYHCWWGADGREIGDYYKGVSVKTCPGTNFFGGNGLTAYRNNLQPLIENFGKEEKVMLETGNDIVWELMHGKHKIEITEVERAIKALDRAKASTEFASLYWIIYKIVNKGR